MLRKIFFAIVVIIFFSLTNAPYVSAACGTEGKYCDVTFPCCTPQFICQAVVNTAGGKCTATTTKSSNVPVISDCIPRGTSCYLDNRRCCTDGDTCFASNPNDKTTQACESPDTVKQLNTVHSTEERKLGEPPCKPDASGTFYTCDTGFGFPIDTRPVDFVKAMFQIILSISGGIALLLVIFSGYRMVMSRGNPEKIQEARDRLTSAIVGLLFIIFSIVILQIIGVDILHIPQFMP